LTILHTNDFTLISKPISVMTVRAQLKTMARAYTGGSAACKTAINDARAARSNNAIPWTAATNSKARCSTPIASALAAEMMNQMGYDAMTVGNHEFTTAPKC
jgi:5'-nucleotidase